MHHNGRSGARRTRSTVIEGPPQSVIGNHHETSTFCSSGSAVGGFHRQYSGFIENRPRARPLRFRLGSLPSRRLTDLVLLTAPVPAKGKPTLAHLHLAHRAGRQAKSTGSPNSAAGPTDEWCPACSSVPDAGDLPS